MDTSAFFQPSKSGPFFFEAIFSTSIIPFAKTSKDLPFLGFLWRNWYELIWSICFVGFSTNGICFMFGSSTEIFFETSVRNPSHLKVVRFRTWQPSYRVAGWEGMWPLGPWGRDHRVPHESQIAPQFLRVDQPKGQPASLAPWSFRFKRLAFANFFCSNLVEKPTNEIARLFPLGSTWESSL